MEIVNQPEYELISKWGRLLPRIEGIFTWTSIGELCRLAEYASQATHICEIGSYHGKSALMMAMANPAVYILCIDQPESTDAEQTLVCNTGPYRDQITVYSGTSSCLKGAKGLYDFAFIDGGHLFEDVKKDISMVLPTMKAGGIISGHDWRTDMKDGVNRGVLHHFDLDRITVHESIWAVQLP